MSGWRMKNNTLTIKRMKEREIDMAIAELERRGYKLLKKERVTNLHKNYRYRSSQRHREYVDSEMFVQWQAELKRG